MRLENKVALITGGSPEIAHAALYLASNDASYVTMTVLTVDGGYTAQ